MTFHILNKLKVRHNSWRTFFLYPYSGTIDLDQEEELQMSEPLTEQQIDPAFMAELNNIVADLDVTQGLSIEQISTLFEQQKANW